MQKPVFTETMQIGIVVRDLDAAARMYIDDSCEFSGIKVAYLGTQRDLGVILEIFNRLSEGAQLPDATSSAGRGRGAKHAELGATADGDRDLGSS